MTNIQFIGTQAQAKPKGSITAFFSNASTPSLYKNGDDHVLSWGEVNDMVGEAMKKRGFQFSTIAQMQRLLPGFIFQLQDEIDTLTSQLVEKKAKK